MSYSNTDTGGKPADPYKEKNLEDPSLEEKMGDLVDFIDRCKFCMMTTRMPGKDLLVSRCMALAAKESNNTDLLFYSNSESGKTSDLSASPSVNLGFLSTSSSGEWASISGQAVIEDDREVVRKHYSPSLKAWVGDLGDGVHDGGPDDPRIVVIRVKAATAQYAIAKRTAVGTAVEVVKGIVTGEVAGVNRLRQLSEEEIGKWRSMAK